MDIYREESEVMQMMKPVRNALMIENINRLKIIAIVGSLVNVFIIYTNGWQFSLNWPLDQDTGYRLIWIAASVLYYFGVGKTDKVKELKPIQKAIFYGAAFISLLLSALITSITYAEQGTTYLFIINMLLTGAVMNLTLLEIVLIALPSFGVLTYAVLTVPQGIMMQKGNLINIIAVAVFSMLITVINYRAKVKQIHYLQIIEEQTVALKRLAEIDDLTGIENRRKIMSRLDEIWDLSVRGELSFSLLMIDIDHFKNYNDALGHVAGDVCLAQVAQCIKDTLPRATDHIGRYGGEEFIVILTGTDLSGALRVSESIRHSIMDRHIPHPDSIEPFLTVSIGFACQNHHNYKSAEALLEAADHALYQAKLSGRNCVRS